jgi:aspartate/methionine/tyrosine aminotransferase
MNHQNWIADRCKSFSSSGIRKVFDLAASLKNPINFSIGLPDFDVPDEIKSAAIEAIQSGKNAYSPTQGIAPLREKLRTEIQSRYKHADRDVFVCSGTSGGLVVAMMALVNPGDEVIIFDPYFVMYPPLVKMMGGIPVIVDTYPDFQIDVAKVEAAITDKTKLVLFNSPANPTGVTASRSNTKALAELCAARGIALVSDEIYSNFSFDAPLTSPAEFNADTIVIDGFSKSHAMTGWRLGWVHGPAVLMQEMLKVQQFSFVCAPQPFQWACLAAMDYDMSKYYADYRQKRDRIVAGLSGYYEFTKPDGAFYLFAKAPWGTGTEFVTEAIKHELLMIPGNIFSLHDTHFRISFAAKDEVLDRGIEVLRKLSKLHPISVTN